MLANHIATELRAMYEAVDTPGLQQGILDAFDSPSAALRNYEAMRQALAVIDPDAIVPVPNLEVFQPQEDGSVKYVAPVVQETPLS